MKQRQLGVLHCNSPQHAQITCTLCIRQGKPHNPLCAASTDAFSSPEDIEGYACFIHPVSQGLVNARFASCLHAFLDGHLPEP